MTYREKLQKEHSEAVDERYWGGCCRCPYSWGYEDKQPCNSHDRIDDGECEKCWNREMNT